jgi:metal-dependent amidase/aminoacylase/carboxypeptidase family protein
MRLHLRPDARVHGIITNGGSAVNIIPDYASAKFSIRAAKQKYAEKILKRVIVCAEAAGQATGAQLKHVTIPGCAEMLPNPVMARLFADNWRSMGVAVSEQRPNERIASTDMGNVSHVVPSLHPYISIGPEGMPGHTIEFRDAAASPAGHEGMILAAKGMAMTAIDLLSHPEWVKQAKQALVEALR